MPNFFLRSRIGQSARSTSAREQWSVLLYLCLCAFVLALSRVSNKRVAMADVLGPGGIMEVVEEEIIHE